jgi:chromosome segregation ATPase
MRMSMPSPQQQQEAAQSTAAALPTSEGMEEPERGIMGETQVMDELLRAREAFVCQGWGELLGRLKTGKSLQALAKEEEERVQQLRNKPRQQDGHLQGKFQAAEGDIQALVQAFLLEYAKQGQAQEALLHKKAEVEALLGTLEEAQVRLAKEEEAVAGQQGEQDEEEEEAAEQEGQERVRQLEAAVQTGKAQNDVAETRVQEWQAKLNQLEAAGAAEREAMEADDLHAATAQDETETLGEAARLREQAETLSAVLEMLQGLYNVTVTVLDEAEAGPGEMVLRLAYPSKHALEMTLSTGAHAVQLLHARLEVPPTQQRRKSVATAEAQRLMMNQVDNLVTVAQGLPAPQDLLFLAREVSWMVESRGVAKQEIRELMKRYIVKHNEAMDELTVTFAEGVVASFSLLAGYPQMPGSVRIAGLVGVGGWKDGELAVTSRSFNGLGLDSLTALVDALHERIVELDQK